MKWKSAGDFEVARLDYSDEVVREAVKKILSDYTGTAVAVSTLSPDAKEGPVKGSNIYFRLAMGNILRTSLGEDVFPMNSEQLEIVFQKGMLEEPLSTREDICLVIYPEVGSLPELWTHLRNQSKGKVKFNYPFVMEGLADVVKDSSFELGLRIDLSDLTKLRNIPFFTHDTGICKHSFEYGVSVITSSKKIISAGGIGIISDNNVLLYSEFYSDGRMHVVRTIPP